MKDSKTNIIFIHKGNSWYLHLALIQAKKTNPDANIILIGTKENGHFRKIANHHLIDDYSKFASTLPHHYTHYSTNSSEFELFCLQRWFVLSEFMSENDLESCIYMDSDILIYRNLTEIIHHFKDAEIAFSGFSPHTTIINTQSVLKQLCDFIIDFYKREPHEKVLNEKFDKFITQNGAGGISDMTFFYEFRLKYPEKFASTIDFTPGMTFDITIDTTEGYETETDIKKIVWIKQKYPLCFTEDLEEQIYFTTLHFQGKYKQLMFEFSKPKTITFVMQHYYFILHYYIQKLHSKFAK